MQQRLDHLRGRGTGSDRAIARTPTGGRVSSRMSASCAEPRVVVDVGDGHLRVARRAARRPAGPPTGCPRRASKKSSLGPLDAGAEDLGHSSASQPAVPSSWTSGLGRRAARRAAARAARRGRPCPTCGSGCRRPRPAAAPARPAALGAAAAGGGRGRARRRLRRRGSRPGPGCRRRRAHGRGRPGDAGQRRAARRRPRRARSAGRRP